MDRYNNNKIRVYAMDCAILQTDEAFARGLAMLGNPLRERTERCRNQTDKRRRLSAYLLLERAFAQYRQDCAKNRSSAEKQKIASDIYRTEAGGKPYLEGVPAFQFSLSHSGECAVCAVSDTAVGVDVQIRRPLYGDIAGRFFSEREAAYCKEITEQAEKEMRFLSIWCAREASVKLTGQGLAGGISQYEADPIKGFVRNIRTEERFRLWEEVFTLHGETYVLAVCGQMEEKQKRTEMEWIRAV